MNSLAAGPIFVVGSPRTGTTLTREILTLHPEVFLYNEIHYNERVVDVMGDRGPLSAKDLDRAIDTMIEHGKWSFGAAEQVRAQIVDGLADKGPTHADVLAAFLSAEASAQGATIWGDSSPQDILYMDVLKRWYPNAKFVGIVRDPRAFLASYKNYYKKGIKRYRNRFNPMTNSMLWLSYMNALLAAKNSALAPDLMLLKYEDLVADPEGRVRELCSFIGLEFDSRMLAVQRRNSSYIAVQDDKKETGIQTGSVDRWREVLTRAELWILERNCSSVMRTLGYEPDGIRLGVRDLPGLLAPALQLPVRLFNLLFRSRKPFTMNKLRRVLGSSQSRGGESR